MSISGIGTAWPLLCVRHLLRSDLYNSWHHMYIDDRTISSGSAVPYSYHSHCAAICRIRTGPKSPQIRHRQLLPNSARPPPPPPFQDHALLHCFSFLLSSPTRVAAVDPTMVQLPLPAKRETRVPQWLMPSFGWTCCFEHGVATMMGRLICNGGHAAHGQRFQKRHALPRRSRTFALTY